MFTFDEAFDVSDKHVKEVNSFKLSFVFLLLVAKMTNGITRLMADICVLARKHDTDHR